MSFKIVLPFLVFLCASCSKQNFSKVQKVTGPENTEAIKSDVDDIKPKAPVEETLDESDNVSLKGPAEVTVSEKDGFAILDFEISEPLNTPLIFDIQVNSGSAQDGQDYMSPAQSKVILKARRTKFSVEIPILNDDLWDVTDESFTVHLQSQQFTSETSVTIIDDESMPSISLRDSFFQNPTGTQPNAIIFGNAPDQDVNIKLRSDLDKAEAQQNFCGTDTSTDKLAIPQEHFLPVPITNVQMSAFQIESQSFNTTWLPLPPSTQRFTICFHVISIE